MDEVLVVALPGRVVAATAAGATVWCAVGGRLLGYEAQGSLRVEAPAPARIATLAAAGDTLAAAVEPGVVAWLDPRSGELRARLPLGGELAVLGGGGAVWAFDRRSGRAWRMAGEGTLASPVQLGGVDRIACDGQRVWWTTRDDTLLRDGERAVDIGVGPTQRGGIVACSGSVWISVPDALLRVGTWGAELGPPLGCPEGPVPFLACAEGILVGASRTRGAFVLDPSIDADIRQLDVDLGGELDFLVATRSVVWAIPAGRAEARLVTVRPGE